MKNKEKVDPEKFSYSASKSSGLIDYVYEVQHLNDTDLISLEMWNPTYHTKVRAGA